MSLYLSFSIFLWVTSNSVCFAISTFRTCVCRVLDRDHDDDERGQCSAIRKKHVFCLSPRLVELVIIFTMTRVFIVWITSYKHDINSATQSLAKLRPSDMFLSLNRLVAAKLTEMHIGIYGRTTVYCSIRMTGIDFCHGFTYLCDEVCTLIDCGLVWVQKISVTTLFFFFRRIYRRHLCH